MLSYFDALILFAFLFLGPASLSLPAASLSEPLGPIHSKVNVVNCLFT
jgi:hypothetical protein